MNKEQPMPEPKPHAFYSSLANLWPLISPVEDYRGEAAEFIRVLRQAAPDARTLLELGSGGGHNACYLKEHFELTLCDLSDEMLAVSRALNPACAHVQGDMRTLRLSHAGAPTLFDLVFVHDAIDYMTTEPDLLAVLQTAAAHLRPGGVALFVPDHTTETFEAGTDCGGTDDEASGRAVRFLEWSRPPAPGSTAGVVDYAFVVRDKDGSVHHVHEEHTFGVFPEATWMRLVSQAGFEARCVVEQMNPTLEAEERTPRRMFLGRRLP
jgi:SAM-dependent methyltransferase